MNEWWIYCTGEQREQVGGGSCCVRLREPKGWASVIYFSSPSKKSSELRAFQIVYLRVVLQCLKLKVHLESSIFRLFSVWHRYGHILWLWLCLYLCFKGGKKAKSWVFNFLIRSDLLGARKDVSILQNPKTVFCCSSAFLWLLVMNWVGLCNWLLRIWNVGSELMHPNWDQNM